MLNFFWGDEVKLNMSYILSNLAQKTIEGWNKRPLSFEDGEMLCHQLGVRLLFENIKSRGEYMPYKKIPFIILRKNLKQKWWAWVLWHEIAHHLLHYPGNYLFSRSTVRKIDFEANFIAAIALLPTAVIQQLTAAEIIAEYGYPEELIRVRKLIYDFYKI
jgi:Zn-dependent peptidase ImmA (M78 family)